MAKPEAPGSVVTVKKQEVTKANEHAIKVVRTSDPVVTENIYDVDVLLLQLATLQKKQAETTAQYDTQIEEVKELLREAEKVGAKSKIGKTKGRIT